MVGGAGGGAIRVDGSKMIEEVMGWWAAHVLLRIHTLVSATPPSLVNNFWYFLPGSNNNLQAAARTPSLQSRDCDSMRA